MPLRYASIYQRADGSFHIAVQALDVSVRSRVVRRGFNPPNPIEPRELIKYFLELSPIVTDYICHRPVAAYHMFVERSGYCCRFLILQRDHLWIPGESIDYCQHLFVSLARHCPWLPQVDVHVIPGMF